MITHDKLKKVRTEIDRYLAADKALQDKFLNPEEDTYQNLRIGIGCRESAALKRASLDLSHALVELRK